MSVKTFFEHIGDFLKEHLGGASSFEHTASVSISIAKPLLNSLVALTAGDPVAAKVSGVVNQVTTALNDTAAVLNGAEATTADHQLSALLGSIQTSLTTLVADADVKNSAKAAEITAIAETLIGEVQAIIAAIPADHSVPVVGAAKTAAA